MRQQADDPPAVVIRFDHQIDHQRGRQTDRGIQQAVGAVLKRLVCRRQADGHEHDARQRHGKLQFQLHAQQDEHDQPDADADIAETH